MFIDKFFAFKTVKGFDYNPAMINNQAPIMVLAPQLPQ